MNVNLIGASDTARGKQLVWFECDKGWLGVEPEYRKRAYDFISRAEFNRDPMHYHKTSITLLEVMNWAEHVGVPYEISTVTPDVVAQQRLRAKMENEKIAIERQAAECFKNGFNTVPEKKEPSHRIGLIRDIIDELDKKFSMRPKPIEHDCYYLLRNIAKYIVEQADDQRDPEG